MAFWGKLLRRTKAFRFGYAGIPWGSPPDRDVKGYLDAYGTIYSLFGIALRIATAVSEVRWRLYRGSERSERSQIAEHPILKLLDFANEFQTGQEIMELTQLHMDIAGRAYWHLARNGLNVPGEIWVMPPHQMRIIPAKEKFIAGYIYQNGAESIPLGTNDVIRFPMPDPVNPYGGIGYAQASALVLDSELYSSQWHRNFFYNSARPDAALEYDEKLSDEEFERLREQWRVRHGGLSNAHKVAILEGGVKYKQIQVTQKEMDFLPGRKFDRESLMFTFGMPLSVMGISENVNRANAEAGDYTFARWLVKPRCSRLRGKLNEQLVPMFPQAKGVELDYDEVVPETVEMKKGLAESGVKSGWMTINEARKLNGFDPIANGDQLLIPLNLIPTKVKAFNQWQQGGRLIGETVPLQLTTKGYSEEQKEMVWRQYAVKTERQEIAFKRILKNLFGQQADEVIGKLKDADKPEDALFDQKAAVDIFQKRFKPVIELVFTDAAEEEVKQEFPLDAIALEWIAKRSLILARSLNETTREKLRTALAEGFAEGESIPKLTRRIRDFYDEQQKWRAPLTARTEVIAASNEGALWRYEQEGVEKSEFYAALDERTCDECMDFHGQIYPTKESHGLIPVHPACRCTWIPIVE